MRDENQKQIFSECKLLKEDLQLKGGVNLEDVYGDEQLQKSDGREGLGLKKKLVGL